MLEPFCPVKHDFIHNKCVAGVHKVAHAGNFKFEIII